MKEEKQSTLYSQFLRLPITPAAKLVFKQMEHYARNGGKGVCFAKYATLADELVICEKTVQRATAELRRLRLISEIENSTRRNLKFTVANLEKWLRENGADQKPKQKPDQGQNVRNHHGQNVRNQPSPKPSITDKRSVESRTKSPRPIKHLKETHTEREQTQESNGSSTALVCVSPPSFLPVLGTPPKPELPDRDKFENLMGIFVALGKGMSPVDYRNCENFWRWLAPEERIQAHDSAVRQLPDWQTRPTEKIPQPWNYLGGKYWTRQTTRILPQRKPMSKAEIGFEQAKRILRAEGLFG
jgi:hypothetical protein